MSVLFRICVGVLATLIAGAFLAAIVFAVYGAWTESGWWVGLLVGLLFASLIGAVGFGVAVDAAKRR